MNKINGFLILLITFLVMGALLFGGITYQTTYAKTEILNSSSSDGQYTLVVYMIGEPDWPFGATHCRFDLMNNDNRITKYSFDIHDDGATAHENNFDISWGGASVTITVSGSEQENIYYQLSFDGSVNYWQEKAHSPVETQSTETKQAEQANHKCTDGEYPKMIMVQDILYYDCGEISTAMRCDMMDGTIDKMAKEVPIENNQSNFGIDYGYQFGSESDTIEVCINDEWHIFKKYEKGIFEIVDEYLSIYYRNE